MSAECTDDTKRIRQNNHTGKTGTVKCERSGLPCEMLAQKFRHLGTSTLGGVRIVLQSMPEKGQAIACDFRKKEW